jgi:hypothetical protein
MNEAHVGDATYKLSLSPWYIHLIYLMKRKSKLRFAFHYCFVDDLAILDADRGVEISIC